jgi:hypothetical protein
MGRESRAAAFALLLCGAAGCDVDGGPRPGAHERCGSAGAVLAECGPAALAGAEDACWRLVECGAVPAANPESNRSCCLDWASCVDYVEGLPDEQFEAALACIESAACDELRPRGVRAAGQTPACLDQL